MMSSKPEFISALNHGNESQQLPTIYFRDINIGTIPKFAGKYSEEEELSVLLQKWVESSAISFPNLNLSLHHLSKNGINLLSKALLLNGAPRSVRLDANLHSVTKLAIEIGKLLIPAALINKAPTNLFVGNSINAVLHTLVVNSLPLEIVADMLRHVVNCAAKAIKHLTIQDTRYTESTFTDPLSSISIQSLLHMLEQCSELSSLSIQSDYTLAKALQLQLSQVLLGFFYNHTPALLLQP